MSAAVRACATRETETEADLEPPAEGGGNASTVDACISPECCMECCCEKNTVIQHVWEMLG